MGQPEHKLVVIWDDGVVGVSFACCATNASTPNKLALDSVVHKLADVLSYI